jgi:hypothetical protein
VSPFALDANTLNYFMRGEGRVAHKLQAISPQQVAIPAIVGDEIRHDLNCPVRRSARHRRANQRLVLT